MIYSYLFEDQDFKLRKSKKTVIANNQDIEQKDYAGTIIDIDYKKKKFLLKRGNLKEFYHQFYQLVQINHKEMIN